MTKTAAAPVLVERIAHDLQAGRFTSGMWLKQIDLERRYGCSRSEIRRALEALAHKRLIQHVPNKGYYVYDADDERVMEILQIRTMLETAAAERIVSHARPHEINELEALARRFEALLQTGTILEIYETNLAFHKALLSCAGNRQLVEFVDDLRLKTSPAPSSQWSTRARIEQSSREHFEMVEAVRRRDAEALRRVILCHIEQSAVLSQSRPEDILAASA